MKIKLKSIKHAISVSLMTAFLVSCGGGGDDVPKKAAPIPIGTVKGVVMIGPVENATLTVYKLDPKTGDIITIPKPYLELTDKTGSTGIFNFTLQEEAEATPLVICATNGRYVEPGGEKTSITGVKTFDPDEKLCAAMVYKKASAGAKKDTVVNITYYTHLAYGLMKFDMSKGTRGLLDKVIAADAANGTAETIELGAIGQANEDVKNWLGFQVPLLSLTPKQINDSSSIESNIPSDELKYGLAIAGVSSVVDWLVVEKSNEVGAPAVITEGSFEGVKTIELAQLTYDDVSADGELNGIGKGAASIQMVGTKIDAHVMLHHLPSRMFAVVGNSAVNKSTLNDINKFSGFIISFAEFRGAIFDPLVSVPSINSTIPNITHPSGFDTTKLLQKTETFKVNAFDLLGLKSIKMTFFSGDVTSTAAVTGFTDLIPTEPQDANDPSLKTWKIDTTKLLDGPYTVRITAINNQDKSKIETIPNLKVGNSGVNVTLTRPTPNQVFNNKTPFTFEAEVTDSFGSKSVVFDVVPTIVVDDKTVNTAIAMPASVGKLPIVGKTQTFTTTYDFSGIVTDDLYKVRVVATPGSNIGVNIFDLVPFGFDSQTPTGSITLPTAGTPPSTTAAIPVEVTFQDLPKANSTYASGIKGVELFIGNKTYPPLTVTLGTKNGTATGSVTVADEGVYMLNFRVTDLAGNIFTPPNATSVVYDKTDPVVLATLTSKGVDVTLDTTIWNSLVSMAGTATDTPGTGISKVEYKVGANGTLADIPFNADGSFSVADIKPANGTHDIVVVATDKASRKGQKLFSGIKFDTQAPIILKSAQTGGPNDNVIPPEIKRTVPNVEAKPGFVTAGTFSALNNQFTTVYTVLEEGYLPSGTGSNSGILEFIDGVHTHAKVDIGKLPNTPGSYTTDATARGVHGGSPALSLDFTATNVTYPISAYLATSFAVTAKCSVGSVYSKVPALGKNQTLYNVSTTTGISFTAGNSYCYEFTAATALLDDHYLLTEVVYSWTSPTTINYITANATKVLGTPNETKTNTIALKATDVASNVKDRIDCLTGRLTNTANAAPAAGSNTYTKGIASGTEATFLAAELSAIINGGAAHKAAPTPAINVAPKVNQMCTTFPVEPTPVGGISASSTCMIQQGAEATEIDGTKAGSGTGIENNYTVTFTGIMAPAGTTNCPK